MTFELGTMVKTANDFQLEKRWKMNFTPLHVAAINGELSAYQYFLGKIRYINPGNDIGITPLHLAASVDWYHVVEVLLQNGANVNAKDQNGKTPLHDAVWKGHVECCKM